MARHPATKHLNRGHRSLAAALGGILILGTAARVSGEDVATPDQQPSAASPATPPPAAGAVPQPSPGSGPDPIPPAPIHAAGTVVVTPERQSGSLDRTPSSVDVISSDDMHRQGFPINVFSLLDGLEGVDAQSINGGIDGGTARISIRGSPGADTQVLLDGIPVNDPTTPAGDANISMLDGAGLDRIEVVKGAQSGLYGSRASGGVVNLITLRPTSDNQGSIRIEGGSDGTVRLDTGSTGPIGDRFGYAVSIASIHARGFNAQGDPGNDGDPGDHPPDPLDRLGVSARLEAHPVDGTTLYVAENDVVARQFYDSFGDPGDTVSNQQYRSWRTSTGADSRIGSDVEIQADAARTWTSRAFTDLQFGPSGFDSREDYGSVRVITTLVDHGDPTDAAVAAAAPVLTQASVTLGSDATHDLGTDTSPGVSQTNGSHLVGVWAQVHADDPWADFSAVIRHDRHDQAGDANDGRLALAIFLIGQRLVLHGAYGTAFRAPSLFELYDPNFGNPALRPERSTTTEAGVRSRLPDDVEADVTVFRTHYRTMIGFDPVTFQSINVDGPRIQGVEARLGWGLHRDGPSCLVTWTWKEDDQGGAALTFLPRQDLAIMPAYTWDPCWAGLRIDAVGSRFAGGGDLPGYVLIGGAAGCKVGAHGEIYLRVDNATDTDYVIDPPYTTPGTSASLGLILTY